MTLCVLLLAVKKVMGVANPAIINAQKQYERAHDTLMVSDHRDLPALNLVIEHARQLEGCGFLVCTLESAGYSNRLCLYTCVGHADVPQGLPHPHGEEPGRVALGAQSRSLAHIRVFVAWFVMRAGAPCQVTRFADYAPCLLLQVKQSNIGKQAEERVWPYLSPYADPVFEKVGSSSYYQATVNHLKPIAANGM